MPKYLSPLIATYESLSSIGHWLRTAKKDLSENDKLDVSEFQHVARFASSSGSTQLAWKRKLSERSHACVAQRLGSHTEGVGKLLEDWCCARRRLFYNAGCE